VLDEIVEDARGDRAAKKNYCFIDKASALRRANVKLCIVRCFGSGANFAISECMNRNCKGARDALLGFGAVIEV